MKKVFEFIDAQADRYVEGLREFLRLPSISAQKIGLDECAAWLRNHMVDCGVADASVMPTKGGPPVVFGSLDGVTPKTLLCYAHYDVQPPEPFELWTTPPFSADVRDGVIYARGAVDNKSGVLAFLYAAEAFRRVQGKPPLKLKFLFEGEEEIGSPHLSDWVEKNLDLVQADGMHCLDGGPEAATNRPRVALGNKAILYVQLSVKCGKRDVHSSEAAWLVNPAWRLIEALTTLRTPDGRILIEGWLDDWIPPNEDDICFLKQGLEDFSEVRFCKELGIDRLPPGKSVLELRKERYFGATCNICGFSSGYTGPGGKTIVPSEAFAKLDFRLPPNLDPEKQAAKLRRHLDAKGFADVHIQVITARKNPWKFPPTTDIAQAIMKAATDVFGKAPAVHGVTAENSIIMHTHIPTVLTGFGALNSNLHSPNENIPIDYFIRGIKYAAAIMSEFGLTGPKRA